MGPATARPRVLVADGDAEALRLTVQRLERTGYEVAWTRDGAEALAMARSARPDVCVLDVMTPTLTGYDVVRLLREDARTSAIAVILLSALPPDEVAAQGIGDTVDGYVRKPFSAHELRTCVQDVVARRTGPTAAQPPAAA